MAPVTGTDMNVTLDTDLDDDPLEYDDDADDLTETPTDHDQNDLKNADEKERMVPLIAESQPEDDTNSGNHNEKRKLPIDGGYAWLVCACAFIQVFLSDGQLFTFGVLYLYLIDYFQSSKSETALVGAVLMGTSMMIGPIAGAVANRFSLRTAGIVGPLIATLGLCASYFAPNILILTFTYGIIAGSGIGFMFLTPILACNMYFDKRRAIANGLVMCGSGVGIFVFPPLIVYILETYGLPGGWLILAGISLNGCVVGAMIRPLNIVDIAVENEEENDDEETHIETHKNSEIVIRNDNGDQILPDEKTNHARDSNHFEQPTFKYELLNTEQNQNGEIPSDKHLLHVPKIDFVTSSQSIGNTSIKRTSKLGNRQMTSSWQSLNSGYWENVKSRELSRMDICHIGSMHTLPLDIGSTFLNTTKRQYQSSIDLPQNEYKKRSFYQKISEAFCALGGCELLSKPTVILLIITGVLWTGQSTVLTYLVDYGTSVGLSDTQAPFLVSVIGITNCVGKIIVGLVTDIPRVSSTVVYMLCILCAGGANLAIPFVQNYYLLLTIVTIFGLSMAAYCSLRAIVIVDTMGVQHLAGALGLIVMFQGIAYVIGPPIAGMIVEETGNFMTTFVVSAICFFLSASTLLPIIFSCAKREDSRDEV